MVRAGMANLIMRLRELTNAGTADFTIGITNYFSEAQLQDLLDRHVTMVHNLPLIWRPDLIGGGKIEYRTCYTRYRDLEEASSGSARWAVRDDNGNLVPTSDYTPDYLIGHITFNIDQGGMQYYLTACSYDLYASAADVWLRRQAFLSNWYDISSDDQRFARQQAWEHAVTMEKQMRAQAGQNVARGELHASVWLRTDVNKSEI